MNFEIIENLSENEILSLYSAIIEKENLSAVPDAYYCVISCVCSDGRIRTAVGYGTGNSSNSNWSACGGIDGWYLSGGCGDFVKHTGNATCTPYASE